MNTNRRVAVMAAVIRKDDSILIAKRREGDRLQHRWEFPGGKIEPGETPEQCLIRELREELNIEITVGEFIAVSRFQYSHVEIELCAYWATHVGGEPELREHAEIAWVPLDKLRNYDFSEADLPILDVMLNS